MNLKGANLKDLRKHAGFTQQDIASRLGLKCASNVSFLESGRSGLSVDKMVKLSELYNVPIETIMAAYKETRKKKKK